MQIVNFMLCEFHFNFKKKMNGSWHHILKGKTQKQLFLYPTAPSCPSRKLAPHPTASQTCHFSHELYSLVLIFKSFPMSSRQKSPVRKQIFPIQDSNWGLLHCRQILYQLSYQGSQKKANFLINKVRVYLFCFSYSTNQAWVEQGQGAE